MGKSRRFIGSSILNLLAPSWQPGWPIWEISLAHVDLHACAQTPSFSRMKIHARALSISLIGDVLTLLSDLEEVLRAKLVGPPRFLLFLGCLQGKPRTEETFLRPNQRRELEQIRGNRGAVPATLFSCTSYEELN